MEDSGFNLTEINVALPRVCDNCGTTVVDEHLPDLVLYFFSPMGFYDDAWKDVEYECTRCQLSDTAGIFDALRAVYDAREDMFTTEMFEALINDLNISGAFADPRTWIDLQPIVWKWRHRIHLDVLFQQVELVLGGEWAVTFFKTVADAAFKAVDKTMFGDDDDPHAKDEALKNAVAGVRQSMIDSIQGYEGLQSIFKYLEELLDAHGYGTQVSPPNDEYIEECTSEEDDKSE
ncbi:hypothetical protein F4774DRAFT_157665 [Daldinia eschscholtzii]|nr:hypothetical protein F4774DRAFT_157665 [Daldinia eschscholtzii]